MKRLTLVRHANATWKDWAASDFERPLTRRGLSETVTLGKLLLRNRIVPELQRDLRRGGDRAADAGI